MSKLSEHDKELIRERVAKNWIQTLSDIVGGNIDADQRSKIQTTLESIMDDYDLNCEVGKPCKGCKI